MVGRSYLDNLRKYAITPSTVSRTLAVDVGKVHRRARLASHDDDDILRDMIEEATDELETEIGRAFINRTYTMRIDHFPYDTEAIRLPIAPVQSITSIAYTNSSGTSVTWSSSLYQVDTRQEPARVLPAYNQDWPDIRSGCDDLNSVTVTFVAGYGTCPDDIPPLARKAIASKVVSDYTGCEEDMGGPKDAWRNAVNLLKWRE